MRKLRQFKASIRMQRHRLTQLEERLARLRDKFARSNNIASRNNVAEEGKSVKGEVLDLKVYLAECEHAIKNWINTDDSVINNLSDFRYWRRNETG